MCARVLCDEATPVDMYHCLVELLLVRTRDWLIVHKSDLDMSVWIVINIALMVSDRALGLGHDFLSSLSSHELSETLVIHVVVGERLFQGKSRCEHRHKDLHVRPNTVQNDLGAFLD